MARQLRITREPPKIKESIVRSACEVIMSDPLDEESCTSSTWDAMIETAVLKGKFSFTGEFSTEWCNK
jgi:hypothetical protein